DTTTAATPTPATTNNNVPTSSTWKPFAKDIMTQPDQPTITSRLPTNNLAIGIPLATTTTIDSGVSFGACDDVVDSGVSSGGSGVSSGGSGVSSGGSGFSSDGSGVSSDGSGVSSIDVIASFVVVLVCKTVG
ncbi:12267_t:CDS:2, partial [Entrophospora sp. SA101]